MSKLIQYSIVKKSPDPIKQFKLTTTVNDDVILVESNLFAYNLVKMFYPFVLSGGLKMDSHLYKFESVDQINRTSFTVWLRELENEI